MMKIDIKITHTGERKNEESKELSITVKSEQKSLRDVLNTIMRFVLKNSDLKDYKI